MADSLPPILLAQVNPLVGDIPGNAERVVQWAREAERIQPGSLVVFPELMLTGYPPEDLLLRPSLQHRVEVALEAIARAELQVDIVLGLPWREEGQLYNCAAFLARGHLQHLYRKRCLPNYQVFDEKRYFVPGEEACVFEWRGHRVGLTVCEDIWEEPPVRDTAAMGAEVLININASPFHVGKHQDRRALLESRAQRHGLGIVYLNLVGGQDELIFDGASFAVTPQGRFCFQGPQFKEGLYPVTLPQLLGQAVEPAASVELDDRDDAVIYQALVLAVRDYVEKNRFQSVVLGLSGGIDSALTLAIAVDALGAERVRAVMMPFRYTSRMSLEDAEAEARALGVRYEVLPIEPIYAQCIATLAPLFEGLPVDTTEENLQARIRGVLLMSLSNKTGALVLTTGNKSEMAVGYATLYGDMAGGYDVLKDVYKTTVFRLARYRNTLSPCIPERVITRPPSAELAPDQRDEDSLPPYPVLDQILALYVEQDLSGEEIVARGFERETVYRVLRLVDVNEYKRRQAPVGPRLTPRGFGKDRRYPITSGWKIGR